MPSPFDHFRDFSQQLAADCGLHLCHAPVSADFIMDPAKNRGGLRVRHLLVILAMIFKAPSALPQTMVVGGKHSAFAAGSHYLVLAKGKGCNISDRTHGPILIDR